VSKKTELSSLLLNAAERLSLLEAVVFDDFLVELREAEDNGTSRRAVLAKLWQYATTTTMAQASLRALATHLMGEDDD
jgi:hypothetical protein